MSNQSLPFVEDAIPRDAAHEQHAEYLNRGKVNLLYLEEVCHDPVSRLVSLLDEHPSSSDEMKCLLLNILSTGKVDELKSSLIGSDTTSDTEPLTDTERSPSSKYERKSLDKASKPSCKLARQRPGLKRTQSERRHQGYSVTSMRSFNGSGRRRVSPKRVCATATNRDRDQSSGGDVSTQSRYPLPGVISKQDQALQRDTMTTAGGGDGSDKSGDDRTTRPRTRSSSTNQRTRRSGSADPLRPNSFNRRNRRTRSNDREQISRSVNLAIANRTDSLSLSMHATDTKRRSSHGNQRLCTSLHHNAGGTTEKTARGTSVRHSLCQARLENDNEDSHSIGSSVTHADEASTDTCMQFHPDGAQEVKIQMSHISPGIHVKNSESLVSKSEHSKKDKLENKAVSSKERRGIYGFLTRQLSKEKMIGKQTNSTMDENESDIESDIESENSVSSFHSDSS
ncbi:hypothetical protein IV203_005584 [Nitzschia inconspicua]|uniref:Uncharacterized protein n=1 Tax=Nitzschia inconspicua TaxID=303405 RepID=A0A9K3KNC6_9STRA|nr:hypothetical protein IV203_005578 [Nitzschia inconspicua]KAG7346516.1 hypothetical protein IV203_005584 [Nitzschia inconspicua]